MQDNRCNLEELLKRIKGRRHIMTKKDICTNRMHEGMFCIMEINSCQGYPSFPRIVLTMILSQIKYKLSSLELERKELKKKDEELLRYYGC